MNYKYRNDLIPLWVIETGETEAPLISCEDDCTLWKHELNGEEISNFPDDPPESPYDLIKIHPCDTLIPGEFVMVWNKYEDPLMAHRRIFNKITSNNLVEARSSVSHITFTFDCGLPTEIWDTKFIAGDFKNA